MMAVLPRICLLLVLPTLVYSQCPPGCQCLPGNILVNCKGGAVNSFPVIGPETTSLDLTNSLLLSPQLQRSNFTGMHQLEKLTLKGCGINEIGYRTFADMTSLDTLDLSSNNLIALAEGSLNGLRLEYLYIDSNPNLRLVDTSFRGATTQILSLKKCELTDVRAEVFMVLKPELRKLFLDGNKIERFPRGMLSVFQFVETAKIYDNPLICDCESRWLKDFYDLNSDSTTTDQMPRCAGPTHVAGQFFNRLSASDFYCDKPTLHATVSFTEEKGILTCTSRGNPGPVVSWHRPNGVISRSAPASNIAPNTNVLELLPGEPNIQGDYRCVASNDGGNISLSVNVNWPFPVNGANSDNSDGSVNCGTAMTDTTRSEVILSNTEQSDSVEETDVFKIKYFTLVDIVGAILGTFVCTLIITVVTLHFCVYRRRKASQYTTPTLSEYSSSSNGSDKNTHYPMSLHSLHTSQMHSQRPLPNKPYTHKMYDENHYMATNIEERDEFLRLQGTNGRITPASSCDTTCQACRTMAHPSVS